MVEEIDDGRRAALSRAQVLRAALTLIDAEGVEALSMRKLGKALDRDPMRLYRHAASKNELLDGVVDVVLSELEVPPTDNGDWEAVLRRSAHAFRAVALAHPNVVPLWYAKRGPPRMRPLGLRCGSAGAVVEAGSTSGRAARCRSNGFLYGPCHELQENVQTGETDEILGASTVPARGFRGA